jgi:hypothetical protein
MAIDRNQYNLLVDDDGSGTTGTVIDKNKFKVVILDPIDTLITDPTAFTPTIISSGGGTPTYSLQVGRWRRVNGWVEITGQITLATFGTLAAGSITIGGLPVAAVNISALASAVAVPFWTLTTAAIHLPALIQPNTSVIVMQIVTAAVTTPAAMQKSDLSATSDFVFSAAYPSA